MLMRSVNISEVSRISPTFDISATYVPTARSLNVGDLATFLAAVEASLAILILCKCFEF